MQKKKQMSRFLNLLIVGAFILAVMVPSISAAALDNVNMAENGFQEFTFDEYIQSLNLDTENVVDIVMGTVQMASISSSNATLTSENMPSNELEVPAVIVTRENEDGTLTSSAYIELAVDDNNNLTSAIQVLSVDGTNEDESYIFSAGGFTVTMEATYYMVKMTEYGQSGYAFAPSFSYFTIKRGTASGTPTNCTLYTSLHGPYSVKNTDPSIRVEMFPMYQHTYNAGTPTLSYKYSFNDYSLYSNSSYDYGGYSGQLIHVPNGGEGSYYLKCDFTYGGNDYTLRFGIYNIGNLT